MKANNMPLPTYYLPTYHLPLSTYHSFHTNLLSLNQKTKKTNRSNPTTHKTE